MELTPEELRVLGALVEKQRTTPEQYPLSLNALRLACNQSTNRDPVVEYDEPTIRQALERLARRRWVRLASGSGSRATKYRHLFDEALDLDRAETAVLAVLMLRGAQTPGELRARTERLHRFPDHAALMGSLDRLAERELVERRARRPGQKEDRYAHRFGADEASGEIAAEPAGAARAAAADATSIEQRVAALEAEVAELRAAVGKLARGLQTP